MKVIFKLKHDIANDSELALAKSEIMSFGENMNGVRNMVDLLIQIPELHRAIEDGRTARFQDAFTRMIYPGKVQAYFTDKIYAGLSKSNIDKLTYYRDVFLLFSGNLSRTLSALEIGYQAHKVNVSLNTNQWCHISQSVSVLLISHELSVYIIRIVPSHCFLEVSDHVVRLARSTRDVNRMYSGMLKHFQGNFDRPYVASVQMGYKWIEDFIDDRRPPNAYASHSLFGLRGRFFPRMVRSLSNYLCKPGATDCIVDPFGGVGTLGIETSLLGLRSHSYDINPFFVEVSNAKHIALDLTSAEVAELQELLEFSQMLRLPKQHTGGRRQLNLFDETLAPIPIHIPAQLSRNVNKESLKLLGILRRKIELTCSPRTRKVALLALAYYAKSFLRKYTHDKILKSFWSHVSRTIYLHTFLQQLYSDGMIGKPVKSTFELGDVRSLHTRKSNIANVITSPPYTTAIDYVGNDGLGFYTIGLRDHTKVEMNTIGSTKLGKIAARDSKRWNEYLPSSVKTSHNEVEEFYPRKAQCLAKYFYDMNFAIESIASSMRHGGKLALIVCSEHEFGGRRHIKYPVASPLVHLAKTVGLELYERIDIDLNKNNDGSISQDSILLFEKHG